MIDPAHITPLSGKKGSHERQIFDEQLQKALHAPIVADVDKEFDIKDFNLPEDDCLDEEGVAGSGSGVVPGKLRAQRIQEKN